jgi:antitoxin component YwqK of YwqJK toxin-antitoxin module
MDKYYNCQLLGMMLFVLFFISSCNKEKEVKKIYYSSGAIKSSMEYLDSLKDGRSYEYYENGKLSMVKNWWNDTLDGEAFIYYPEGSIKERIHYAKGKLNGDFVNYFESNGNIRMKGFYRNGCLNGKVFQYYELDSGKVMAEIDPLVQAFCLYPKRHRASSSGQELSEKDINYRS